MLPHHLNSIYDERTQIIFRISDPILELMAELLEDHTDTGGGCPGYIKLTINRN